MKTFFQIFGILIVLGCVFLFLSLTVGTCNTATKMVNDGQNTVYQQFKPSELLRKYEWFKDAAAQLDNKLATLKVYDEKFQDLKSQYNNAPRNQWSREDREQYNLWQSEQAGISASYNELSAQYNAAMVKFNYAFCNKGTLPQGADIVLPREYRIYITK